jgi:hypothetical protein
MINKYTDVQQQFYHAGIFLAGIFLDSNLRLIQFGASFHTSFSLDLLCSLSPLQLFPHH